MKKIAVLSFAFCETFCDQNSSSRINNSDKTFEKAKEVLPTLKHDVFVDILPPHVSVRDFKIKTDATKIDFTLKNRDSIFHIDNVFTLNSLVDDVKQEVNGSNFDFIIRPEEYDIFIIGIDLNGVFINTIKQLEALGFKVFVLSNLAKLFNKATSTFIQQSGVKFCSYKTAENIVSNKNNNKRVQNVRRKTVSK